MAIFDDWEEVQGEDRHYINTQLSELDCAHSNWKCSYEKIKNSAFEVIDAELPNAHTQMAVN